MGRVDRPGGPKSKISEVGFENFANGVGEISGKFGAKFEFSKNFRSKIDIFAKKLQYYE